MAQQLAHVQSQLETQSTRQVELEKVHSCLCEFDRVWEALDPAERKEALHTVIESAALEKAQGEDLVLRLKLAFVPERQLPLPSYLKRKATHGVESLSPRELAYLTHRQRGLSDESIALIWDCQALYTAAMARKLLARLGVPSVAEALELAAARMQAEAHALPLEGRMQRRSASRQGFGWTAKRLAVLEAVRRGTPRAEACRELGLTRRTFSEHLRQMKRAAAVQTPEQLLHWAGQRGLLPDMQGEMAKACAPS